MSLHDDLVSVVIPVYNSEKFLAESIESVLNQTYKNIEIIAVDDGSQDNSLEILQRYSDRITILSQENQGLTISLNSAVEKIKGRWFKWFSPDDILNPKAIEILVKNAKKLPENMIVYSNWELIDENGKKLRDFSESNYNDLSPFDFNVRLLDGQQINVNTALIPTSLFEKGCTFQKLEDPVAIDYDFFLRAGIFFNTGFYLVEEPLVQYRIHTKQLSHQNISQSLSYLSSLKEQIFSELEIATRKKYLNSLSEYNKKKPISKKTMELGLKIASKTLRDDITDKIVLFYLNKIRRTR